MALSSFLTSSFFLLSSFLFFSFLIFSNHSPPNHPSTVPSRRSLFNTTSSSSSFPSCNSDSSGIAFFFFLFFDYAYLHFCIVNQNLLLSIPFLTLILLLHFYFLVKTAQSHFSLAVTKLASHLNLSPSMAAVTLLALGNGAPDVFASLAALRSGQPGTGLGAILSAGAFVSAFVVGFVAIYAAPFSVHPAPFVRDVFFYLIAASSLFYVYLSAEIFVWQALGFVGFYVFFVGFVFWMDVGGKEGKGLRILDCESGGPKLGVLEEEEEKRQQQDDGGVGGLEMNVLQKLSKLWEVPVSALLALTIPNTTPSEWSRFYLSANIALCPLALLYSCNSFIPLNHKIVFLLPHTHFPIWSVVLFTSSLLALVHYIVEKEPSETEQMPVVLVAFVMSVFWISTVAGELLQCLAAIGTILELPPALLGLTVLAWGNSVGDLVTDVAVAKAGQPAMAMAGCFAGPMFNMLVGLGTALVIQTVDVYPMAYKLQFHVSIVVAFVFLLLSLMGSLLVMTWFRFRVPRFWGFCLVGLYVVFMAVSLGIAKFSR